MIHLKGKHLLKILDLTTGQIAALVDLGVKLKKEKKNGTERQVLKGKNIALIFEKDSTRTRCAFEIAAYDQGAHVTYLGPSGTQIGKKESIKDTARVLGRLYDGIEYRGYEQEIVEVLAEFSGVPVWNGLTNQSHPTQVLADFVTMEEHYNKTFDEIKFCYIGDAHNNIANSLMTGAARMGMDFRAICPPQCAPDPLLVKECNLIASRTGAKITVTDDPVKGVRDCDFVYTDVWVSMGEPESVWEERIKILKPYQVNAALMEATRKSTSKFMHCLPAFHDMETVMARQIMRKYGIAEMEVTNEVFNSPASIVFDQAENRMHSIKAVLIATLYGDY